MHQHASLNCQGSGEAVVRRWLETCQGSTIPTAPLSPPWPLTEIFTFQRVRYSLTPNRGYPFLHASPHSAEMINRNSSRIHRAFEGQNVLHVMSSMVAVTSESRSEIGTWEKSFERPAAAICSVAAVPISRPGSGVRGNDELWVERHDADEARSALQSPIR
jgi:hypothetical protein